MDWVLPVEVESLDEGGFFASCSLIQGCHAEGKTLTEALDNLQDVASVLLELIREDGRPLPQGLRPVTKNESFHEEILVTVEG